MHAPQFGSKYMINIIPSGRKLEACYMASKQPRRSHLTSYMISMAQIVHSTRFIGAVLTTLLTKEYTVASQPN